MKGLFAVLLMFLVASPCLSIRIISDANPNFNVVDYGARGDGQSDDSAAFVKVWEDVCRATEGTPTLPIPQGKRFLLQPVEFKGACNSTSIIVELQGDLVVPNSMEAWKWADNDKGKRWIRFSRINGLFVNGGGQIDGQGAAWWNYSNSQRPVVC
ncbi:hypothetical protein L6164_012107 [Bauhinia variegata]|uniref:Uncharacterized protein n=1 Tax=Bauhinia variegata TaxID=167791 RepID=A0ACB9PE30_BAUVA|nr:hypothetical protein L6164_012107 [Bauhinia variegata]